MLLPRMDMRRHFVVGRELQTEDELTLLGRIAVQYREFGCRRQSGRTEFLLHLVNGNRHMMISLGLHD